MNQRKRFSTDGEVQSNRNLSLHLQNNCTGKLFDVIIFKLWTLVKACNFQGKTYTGKLPLISVNFSSRQSHSYPFSNQATQQAEHCTCSCSSLQTAIRSQDGQNKPCPPNTDHLCSDQRSTTSWVRSPWPEMSSRT